MISESTKTVSTLLSLLLISSAVGAIAYGQGKGSPASIELLPAQGHRLLEEMPLPEASRDSVVELMREVTQFSIPWPEAERGAESLEISMLYEDLDGVIDIRASTLREGGSRAGERILVRQERIVQHQHLTRPWEYLGPQWRGIPSHKEELYLIQDISKEAPYDSPEEALERHRGSELPLESSVFVLPSGERVEGKGRVSDLMTLGGVPSLGDTGMSRPQEWSLPGITAEATLLISMQEAGYIQASGEIDWGEAPYGIIDLNLRSRQNGELLEHLSLSPPQSRWKIEAWAPAGGVYTLTIGATPSGQENPPELYHTKIRSHGIMAQQATLLEPQEQEEVICEAGYVSYSTQGGEEWHLISQEKERYDISQVQEALWFRHEEGGCTLWEEAWYPSAAQVYEDYTRYNLKPSTRAILAAYRPPEDMGNGVWKRTMKYSLEDIVTNKEGEILLEIWVPYINRTENRVRIHGIEARYLMEK